MKRLAGFFIFGGLFLLVSMGGLYTQEYNDDPFKAMLPKKEVPVVVQQEPEPVVEEVIVAPKIVVTGVVWGGNFPQALMNGGVYKVGDTVKGTNAVVSSIDRNKVSVEYRGKTFSYGVEKKRNSGLKRNR